ncbi:unnamed protein product, partial [Ectocarpus sp. 4 AP-2014]
TPTPVKIQGDSCAQSNHSCRRLLHLIERAGETASPRGGYPATASQSIRAALKIPTLHARVIHAAGSPNSKGPRDKQKRKGISVYRSQTDLQDIVDTLFASLSKVRHKPQLNG